MVFADIHYFKLNPTYRVAAGVVLTILNV